MRLLLEIRQTTAWQDLRPLHRAVLEELLLLIYQGGGRAEISQVSIAARTGYSREYVNRALRTLCGQKLLWRSQLAGVDAPATYKLGAVITEMLNDCVSRCDVASLPIPFTKNNNIEVKEKGNAGAGRQALTAEPPPGDRRLRRSSSSGDAKFAADVDADVLVNRLQIAIGDSDAFSKSRRTLTRLANVCHPDWWSHVLRIAVFAAHTPSIENVGMYITQQYVDLLCEHDWPVPDVFAARQRSAASRDQFRCPALKTKLTSIELQRRPAPSGVSPEQLPQIERVAAAPPAEAAPRAPVPPEFSMMRQQIGRELLEHEKQKSKPDRKKC